MLSHQIWIMRSLAHTIAVVEMNGMKREGAPTKDFVQFSIGGSNDGAGCRHWGRYKNLKHEDFECDTKLSNCLNLAQTRLKVIIFISSQCLCKPDIWNHENTVVSRK